MTALKDALLRLVAGVMFLAVLSVPVLTAVAVVVFSDYSPMINVGIIIGGVITSVGFFLS